MVLPPLEEHKSSTHHEYEVLEGSHLKINFVFPLQILDKRIYIVEELVGKLVCLQGQDSMERV